MSTTPRLGITRLVEGQASAELTVNDAMNLLDALSPGIEVLNSTLTTPPGSPVEGAVYIVAASASGAWTGQDGKFAVYYNGWIYKTPKGGMIVFDKNAKEWLGYSSVESEWHPLQSRWSTTEHWTGEYRDGSKVYSKVIDFGTLPNTTVKTVNHSITTINQDIPMTIEGMAHQNSPGTLIMPIPQVLSSIQLADVTVNTTLIQITTNYDASSIRFKCRLTYCKV